MRVKATGNVALRDFLFKGLEDNIVNRKEIGRMLKQIDIDKLKNDGPTSIFITCGKKNKTATLTSDREFIMVTVGKFMFKKKYRFKRSELR